VEATGTACAGHCTLVPCSPTAGCSMMSSTLAQAQGIPWHRKQAVRGIHQMCCCCWLACPLHGKASRAVLCSAPLPHQALLPLQGKRGLCGFASTNLDFILRHNGITNVALAGFLVGRWPGAACTTVCACSSLQRMLSLGLCHRRVCRGYMHLSLCCVSVCVLDAATVAPGCCHVTWGATSRRCGSPVSRPLQRPCLRWPGLTCAACGM
jgi:hypothetical protein